MYIIKASCWKCGAAINIAVIKGDSKINHGQVYGPDLFTPAEIAVAQKRDVIIAEHFSMVKQFSYNANTCGNCKKFVGEHYLFHDYYHPATCGDYKCEVIELK